MGREILLKIDGMHCEACVRRVTQALSGVAGTSIDEVNVGTVRVHAPDTAESRQALVAAVAKAGFQAHVEG